VRYQNKLLQPNSVGVLTDSCLVRPVPTTRTVYRWTGGTGTVVVAIVFPEFMRNFILFLSSNNWSLPQLVKVRRSRFLSYKSFQFWTRQRWRVILRPVTRDLFFQNKSLGKCSCRLWRADGVFSSTLGWLMYFRCLFAWTAWSDSASPSRETAKVQ